MSYLYFAEQQQLRHNCRATTAEQQLQNSNCRTTTAEQQLQNRKQRLQNNSSNSQQQQQQQQLLHPSCRLRRRRISNRIFHICAYVAITTAATAIKLFNRGSRDCMSCVLRTCLSYFVSTHAWIYKKRLAYALLRSAFYLTFTQLSLKSRL